MCFAPRLSDARWQVVLEWTVARLACSWAPFYPRRNSCVPHATCSSKCANALTFFRDFLLWTSGGLCGSRNLRSFGGGHRGVSEAPGEAAAAPGPGFGGSRLPALGGGLGGHRAGKRSPRIGNQDFARVLPFFVHGRHLLGPLCPAAEAHLRGPAPPPLLGLARAAALRRGLVAPGPVFTGRAHHEDRAKLRGQAAVLQHDLGLDARRGRAVGPGPSGG